ncbi:reverse transcriptase-like protein, partial [Bacteroides uniformis]|uniref:reverse transcriptase-like protein n=1 Tax=Bacteroides uniformis TaxID=820 RepID=UPI001AA17DBB
LLKKLGAQRIVVHGYSELVIKQVNGECTANNPRLRAYINDDMDLLKTFVEYELVFIPRD